MTAAGRGDRRPRTAAAPGAGSAVDGAGWGGVVTATTPVSLAGGPTPVDSRPGAVGSGRTHRDRPPRRLARHRAGRRAASKANGRPPIGGRPFRQPAGVPVVSDQ